MSSFPFMPHLWLFVRASFKKRRDFRSKTSATAVAGAKVADLKLAILMGTHPLCQRLQYQLPFRKGTSPKGTVLCIPNVPPYSFHLTVETHREVESDTFRFRPSSQELFDFLRQSRGSPSTLGAMWRTWHVKKNDRMDQHWGSLLISGAGILPSSHFWILG